MGIGFVFGISLGIANERARMVARVLAFVPAVIAYFALRPASFAQTLPYQLSTSQLIGVLSALVVSFFYARFWESARKTPRLAMSLGDPDSIRELKGEPAEEREASEEEEEDETDDEDEADEADEAAEKAEAKPAPARTGAGKKKGLVAKAKPKAEVADEPDTKGDPEPEPEAS
jgi:phosphatidylglycerol:prolipoprotein diacylglycerol transferase